VREQAISPKVGNRSGMSKYRASAGASQRPVRRESEGGSLLVRVRSIAGYLPAFLKVTLAIIVGILVFAGYRAAASASFFQIRKVEVQGTSRVSADDVRAVVRKDVEKTGVWKADLKGISAHLEKFTWVRSAVVSRVLPDGIRVRITERVPRAVVRTASGRFRWVDDDAVLLGEMLPTDHIPPFFLRGLNEEDPEGAREENRERVAKFLELQRDWEAAGLSERVSEVNVMDMQDIRAQLAAENAQIEVRLGSEDQAKRLKDALEKLDAQAQGGRGSSISYIDMNQGKRAIFGMTPGAHRSDEVAQPNTTVTATNDVAANHDGPVVGPRDRTVATTPRNADDKPKKGNARPVTKKDPEKTRNTDPRR